MDDQPDRVTRPCLPMLLFAAEPPRILPPAIDLEDMQRERLGVIGRIRSAEQQCMNELSALRKHSRRLGYREGLQQGVSELDELISNFKHTFNRDQRQIVELVIQCVRKIIGDIPAEKVLPQMVERVLAEQVTDVHATVIVHPVVAEELSKCNFDNITFDLNDEMEMTEARVETDDYIKAVGVNTQINDLHKQLCFAVSQKHEIDDCSD